MKKVAVIMAGGLGYRFWPRSSEKKPKQFIHLLGEGTMIQNTCSRLLKIFPQEDIYIVSTSSMSEIIEEQLPDFPKENIIYEPFGRNTAPALALAAINIENKYSSDTVFAAFPSDHEIYNHGEYYQSIETACQAAFEKEGIVTIGVKPTRPETQFGYVQFKQKSEDLGELYEKGLRYSTTFAEKPDKETAIRFLESGDFLWNSGIFCWRFDVFWKSYEQYLSEDFIYFKNLQTKLNQPSYHDELNFIYKQITSISVDYAILEKADNVLALQSSFAWSDLGTWDEFYRLSMKDAQNNVAEGDVITLNTSNSLISSSGKLIALVGMKDVVVIDSEDALLICKRGDTENVKELIDFMRRKHINRY